jgi:hypothetical protein
MSQDPFERVKLILSETRANRLALLLDLTTLLPNSLVLRAIYFAQEETNHALQAFLIQALAQRLPTDIRHQLEDHYPVGAGMTIEDVSIPEGKEAKRLIAQLSEKQRYEVFDRLLTWFEPPIEVEVRDILSRIREEESLPAPVSAEPGGVASVDPPDNTGGGGFEAVDDGFEAVDDGFESVGGGELEEANGGGGSSETTERRDIVNLGFSNKDGADKTLKSDEPLQTEHSYFFWLNIGRQHKDAIGAPTRIDLEKLPEEAVLTVAIFAFNNELAITPGQDIGELKIEKDGRVKVLRQPLHKDAIPLSSDAPADYLDDFLIFPISVPNTEATHRLRCNIYCAQVLVQSYVVSANVKSTSAPVPEACTKNLDYVLSESLRASHLALMTKEPHLLSLMVNDNGDGTHGFRFFGDDGTERFKDDAQIDGQQIAGYLREARAAMRKISWGDDQEWGSNPKQSYRYQKEKFDEAGLAKDLAYLARAGTRIYAGFQSHLKMKPTQLEALLANSGLIQIALKLSPRAVLPAAAVYDYAWRPDRFDFPTTEFKLCPSFAKAIKEATAGGPPLEDCICFKGGCELKKMIAEIKKPGSGKLLSDLDPIICPSGFWGYRHLLGLPLTLDGANTDIPPVIEFKDSLHMFACVSTDPEFSERDPHLDRLKALEKLKFARDDGYDPFLIRLRTISPHLVYFYCHGGVRAGSFNPFLQVGASDEIDPSNWLSEGIEWTGPNPLVFINGCHTTSLNPEVTLDFVSSFVQTSGAAGVIGTEITIFEPLAVKFAEECFKRFIGAPPHKESMPIGKAVRGARLELLRQGNPLGLVYIPYAVASLRLQQTN